MDVINAARPPTGADEVLNCPLRQEARPGITASAWSQIDERQRPAGSVSGVAPPDDIHRVCNTVDTVATTLHVHGADLSNGSSVRRIYEQRDDR